MRMRKRKSLKIYSWFPFPSVIRNPSSGIRNLGSAVPDPLSSPWRPRRGKFGKRGPARPISTRRGRPRAAERRRERAPERPGRAKQKEADEVARDERQQEDDEPEAGHHAIPSDPSGDAFGRGGSAREDGAAVQEAV